MLEVAPVPADSSPGCRRGCGACCIAPSISSAIPGMPDGKPAGVPCVQLDDDLACKLFGRAERPAVCVSLRPSVVMCGSTRGQAMAWLGRLELLTEPSSGRWLAGRRFRASGAWGCWLLASGFWLLASGFAWGEVSLAVPLALRLGERGAPGFWGEGDRDAPSRRASIGSVPADLLVLSLVPWCGGRVPPRVVAGEVLRRELRRAPNWQPTKKIRGADRVDTPRVNQRQLRASIIGR